MLLNPVFVLYADDGSTYIITSLESMVFVHLQLCQLNQFVTKIYPGIDLQWVCL